MRVQDHVAEKLDRIAALSDRSRAYLAAQAIANYVAREDWQLAEIQVGVEEADRDEFASADELAGVVKKYRHRHPRPGNSR